MHTPTPLLRPAWLRGARPHRLAGLPLPLIMLASLAASSGAKAQEIPHGGEVLTPSPVEVRAEPASQTPERRIGGDALGPCVQVDIAGHRAGHLECATQALTDAAIGARRQADFARGVSVAAAGSPDPQVGIASRSGARLRLSENFGRSVRPTAAPVQTYPAPIGARR